jgi:hypothetical protein
VLGCGELSAGCGELSVGGGELSVGGSELSVEVCRAKCWGVAS